LTPARFTPKLRLVTTDAEERIRSLIAQAAEDRDGDGSLPAGGASAFRARHPLDPTNVRALPDRGFGASRLFRILLTNACSFSCAYCPMRAERPLARHALEPALLAEAFLTAYRRGWVTGLFVTSGIPKNPVWAMDRLLELVETLRFRHRYAGYLHAKAVSGCEAAQIERLALLCDRVSYNLEAACQATLDAVAPEKSLSAGLSLLSRIRDVSHSAGPKRLPGDPRPPGRPVASGATSQFVVGIGRESDRDLLAASTGLWKEGIIHHPHFAAFRPIEETPLEGAEETPALRERRLYEADFLVRRYGFERGELVFRPDGRLPLARDPKLTWALAHPERFPVELGTAPRESLLRVPGLGPRTVEKLLALRRHAATVDAASLARIGAAARRAVGFLAWRGRLLGRVAFQEELFPVEDFPVPSKTYSFSPGTFR
jgi:predicted DNA-binding helix-hairpin-helix protein